ncbi:hypothetical protein FOA52_008140 [Chlamydomonas sp. UWO 241]|nr:hypothetical protein FOA52_008140 [Chlamydomonas sp. UWO 241]
MASSSSSPSPRPPTIAVSGLSAVVQGGQYKAVLLDQFGVLHDGRMPYSAATIEGVRRLAAAGLRVYIISNSSRRSSGTIAKLTKMGFDPAWFEGAVTSGDMAHEALFSRPTEWWRALGSKCLHFTWSSRGKISLEGLGLTVTASPSEADFILAHGTEGVGQAGGAPTVDASLEEMRAMMRFAAGRRIPMVVANPDLVTVDGPNGLIVMPGTLAEWYAEMGGSVRLMGKPDAVIYEAAMGALGLPPSQVLAVGDSLEHDIAGAAAAGIDSLFIAGGIHAQELGIVEGARSGNAYDTGSLATLGEEHGAQPTYGLGFFDWGG